MPVDPGRDALLAEQAGSLLGATMLTTGRTSYGAQEWARGGRAVPVRLQVKAV